jgi:hypothetical protein
MKTHALRHSVLALLLVTSAASAQFVKGNEAVRALPGGGKQVETAPLPSTGPIRSMKPCAAAASCHAGPWHMVETTEGLRECTEVYARAGTCRSSSYGKTKLARLWVVKSNGEWLQCQYPDLGRKCVKVFARPPANLPFDAVQ